MRIVVAKINHIGDVVMALPMVHALKEHFPDGEVCFLARGAACDIARAYTTVDHVYDWGELLAMGEAEAARTIKTWHADVFVHASPCPTLARVVKQAAVPMRVGNLYRVYHWHTCNRLVAIPRAWHHWNKRLLDLYYLHPLGLKPRQHYTQIIEYYRDFAKSEPKPSMQPLIDPKKFNLILHPTAITAEQYCWPIDYYARLIEQLPKQVNILVSGLQADEDKLQLLINAYPRVTSLLGRFNLTEFFQFIGHCQGLVAASTGPLHMAAACGVHALGLYRANPTYIKRWAPVGSKAEVIADEKKCWRCPQGTPCACIRAITPDAVLQRICTWLS